MQKSSLLLAALALALASTPLSASSLTIGFETLGLGANSYDNDASPAAAFISDGAALNNSYDSKFDSWAGWAISTKTDPSTPGFLNQYSARPGSGADSSASYAVAYQDFFNSVTPTITLPAGFDSPLSVRLSNTTYTAFDLQDGSAFSKKFGGSSGNDPDFFKLTISAFDASDSLLASTDFFLADYRFASNASDYIVTGWSLVDLSSLGSGVATLRFNLDSSDSGAFGINTPTYFALDNLVLLPEPGSAPLLALGIALALARRQKRRPFFPVDLPRPRA